MDDFHIKFVAFWTFVMAVTYTISGYVYLEGDDILEYEQDNLPDLIKANNETIQDDINENAEWWEQLYSGLGMIWEGMIALISIATFRLPNMPNSISVPLALFFNIMNLVYFWAISGYIKEFVTIVVKIIDAIIPF